MSDTTSFEIFLMAAPGLEAALVAEAQQLGWRDARGVEGGVLIRGGWSDVWRANLALRGAGRVVARIAAFHVTHLAQLDKRARGIDWGRLLRPGQPVRVEATCRASRIYHSGAAEQRLASAIHDALGAVIDAEAQVCVRVRIDSDRCEIGIDTSGEPLHRRGYKAAVAKAPLRETMAALLLRQCSFDGREPVLDPMCGSGTFVIEAAEMAAGLAAGRARRFAFEQLATFDAAAWQRLKAAHSPAASAAPPWRFVGSDRDAGAIRMASANAERAGVSSWTEFRQVPVEELAAPEGPPGLVMVNPPYGARIGDRGQTNALHHALGRTLATRFRGWRVGLLTSQPALAKATGLPFLAPSAPIAHGGMTVRLWRTGVLP